jgi:hypothetical protein
MWFGSGMRVQRATTDVLHAVLLRDENDVVVKWFVYLL